MPTGEITYVAPQPSILEPPLPFTAGSPINDPPGANPPTPRSVAASDPTLGNDGEASQKAPIPVDSPRAFGIEELFFSTTDHRGIIRSGNEVFRRISGYREEALIGRPHNLIRHPDMPAAVYRLVWDFLKRGKAVAGYVKNMAADGKHYWVVAMLTPLPDGHLSVRFKPTSPLFNTIQPVYRDMLRIEQEAETDGKSRAAGMDLSSTHLETALSALGFVSYEAFMTAMLHAELKNRDSGIALAGRRLLPERIPESSATGADVLRTIFRRFHETYRDVNLLYVELDEFSRLNTELNRTCEGTSARSHAFRLTALNATLQATQLGDKGHTIRVVAHRLEGIAHDIATASSDLIHAMVPVESGLRSVVFNLAASRLQLEMVILFCHELALSGTGNQTHDRNLEALQSAFAGTIRPAIETLTSTSAALGNCAVHAEHMRKHTIMMQVAQVVGSVETSGLKGDTPLHQMLIDVRGHTSETRNHLDRLLDIMAEFSRLSQATPAMVERISRALQLTQDDLAGFLALVDVEKPVVKR
jgi:PAS domain S-box-containing protein